MKRHFARHFCFYTEVTMATTQEMLTAVENAIYAICNGGAVSSYSIGGRSLQRYSLAELQKLRDKLKRELSVSKTTTNYATFKNPS